MKNSKWLWSIVLAILIILVGCKPKKTVTLDEPEPVITEPEPYVAPEPEPIDTSDDVSFNEAELEAEFLRKVQENLKNIYFDYNSYTLTQGVLDQLAVAGGFLMEHSSLRVLIEGHCDERGSSEYNMGLGENRARVVKDYLANYGVSSMRMEITSWGKERLENFGCGDEGCHSRNRRALFKVLER
jgi:peptidoglycan-associated lipoprotein